jgi:PAS domain S-box-containing protein
MGDFKDMVERADKRAVYQPDLQQCRDILDNAPIGIFVSTVEGRFVSANLALARIYGYLSVDELLASITDIAVQVYVDSSDRHTFISKLEEYGELANHQCRQFRRDGSIFWASEYARVIRGLDGTTIYYQGFTTDISEQKRVEEELESRVVVLTNPLGSLEEVTIEDLFDVEDLQKLQDQFAEATGVASIITHTNGRPVTRPSNFCRLCNDIIRNSEIGRANCFRSDAVIGRACVDGPTVQTCLSGGLWDAGAGITVGGRHIANWLIGQVRDETQSEENIRAYARKIGVHVEEAVAAYREVPSMTREHFEKIARMLFTLATQLSSAAYQNVQQARFISEHKKVEEALQKNESKLAEYAAQMEQFSLSAASMISIKDEKILFAGISQVIVEHSDFKRVLISLFKDQSPYREIIGYGGLSEEVVTRLAKIPLPPSWYDHVFTEGQPLGQFSYYVPHTLKHILNQEATVFGEGSPPADDSAWHPEDNLFVRLNDGQGNFIGVISVDDSKSGLRPTLETVRPLEIYAGMIAQIIALQREQTNRERLEEQLRMAHKMESVGRLAGGIAHDFNNMLGVILGYTEMILDGIDEHEPIYEALQGIQQAAGRSAELTRQLLAFARKQTIAPKVLDLNDTLESMLSMLRRLIGENVDLIWLPGKNLGQIKMDPTQIDQIVVNLCVNARDAVIRGSGKVTIETGNVVLDKEYCRKNVGAAPGEYVQLVVSDNGCGMDSATISHLFEPFFTTKKLGEGTGLGLATVYGIVKQNESFINVDSELGCGTTFRVYFPRHFAGLEQKACPVIAEQMEQAHETILLVEDESMILEMTKRMLQGQGYTVLSAATPGEAIRIAERHSGKIGLLITDVVMPEMNGRDLAGNLLRLYPGIKRLFMSGYTADVIACHGVLDEGVYFIQKPFSRKDLLDQVRTVLEL